MKKLKLTERFKHIIENVEDPERFVGIKNPDVLRHIFGVRTTFKRAELTEFLLVSGIWDGRHKPFKLKPYKIRDWCDFYKMIAHNQNNCVGCACAYPRISTSDLFELAFHFAYQTNDMLLGTEDPGDLEEYLKDLNMFLENPKRTRYHGCESYPPNWLIAYFVRRIMDEIIWDDTVSIKFKRND